MHIWTETTYDAVEQQYQILLIVIEFFSGVAVWDLIQSLPFDLAFLRRKCMRSLALFAVYAGCRYISLVSMLCRAIYDCALYFEDYRGLQSAYEITYYISMAFACQMLALHGVTLCRSVLVTCALALAQTGIYISMFLAILHLESDMQSVYRPVFCIYFAASSMFITMVVLASMLARRGCVTALLPDCASDTSDSPFIRAIAQLNQSHMFDLVIVSGLWTAATVLCYLAIDPTANLRRLVEFVAYVVTVVCTCRIFRTLAQQKDIQPSLLRYAVQFVRERPEPTSTPPRLPTPGRRTPTHSRHTSVPRAKSDDIELGILTNHPVLSLKTDVLSVQSGPSSSASAYAWTPSPMGADI